MAFLNWEDRQQTSALIYIDGLNTDRAYKEVYMTCNGQRSPNMARTYASSRSDAWRVSGLVCGTRYTVSWTLLSGGNSPGSGSAAFYTLDCTVIPIAGAPSSVSATAHDTISGRISVSWGSGSNATYYRVSIDSIGYESGNITGTSANVTGLSEGTTYTVTVTSYNSRGSGGSRSTSVTTKTFGPPQSGTPGTISVDASEVTRGTATITWGSASNASYYVATIRTYPGRAYVKDSGYLTNRSYSVSGLAEGTRYYVIVTAYNYEYTEGGSRESNFTTHDFGAARPDNWAYTEKVRGQSVNYTASDWNNFCARINEFRDYKGHGPYSFTSAISGQLITATQGNQARAAISTLSSSVPAAASQGSDLTAAFFNSLVSALNNIT